MLTRETMRRSRWGLLILAGADVLMAELQESRLRHPAYTVHSRLGYRPTDPISGLPCVCIPCRAGLV